MKRASVAFAFAALSFAGCQHYEDFILPTGGGTDEEEPVQSPDVLGDSLYPTYTSEYLAPFRENFGDDLLPAVHLYFQDTEGNALADLDFKIYRESDGAVPGNISTTDGSGFWFDEDFAADPGAGRYIVLAGEDTASFYYDGSDSMVPGSDPAIHRFTFRVPEPSTSWDFPDVDQGLIESARDTYRGEGVPAVILYVHESGTPKRSFTASVTTDIPSCDLPVVDQRSTNGSGFTFLTADELCGNGEYLLDLRQGGYYDTFCGPDSDSFIYQGEPVWVDVDIWCE